jgi:hypothetical protein
MTRAFDEAVASVRARRKALEASFADLRGRITPPQVAEDALSLIDPELALLGRIRERIQQNRLLSLAVLAGVGWLVGAPRQQNGEALGAGNAGTAAPRANTKEKKNDSGQVHGEHWSGTGSGRQEIERQEELAKEAVLARRRPEAQPDGGGGPLQRKPEERQLGERVEVAEQRPDEEQPQQQP